MTSDLLIKNALVWPGVGRAPIADGKVLIRAGRIARVGRFHARADTVIDADGCLVMPGLVQGHVHLCQTLFRGRAEDQALLPWLTERIWPLEAALDRRPMTVAARLACAEMIRGGITAFLSLETTRHTGAIFEAVAETWRMGVIAHGLMDESCGCEALAVDIEDGLADCDVLLDQWRGHADLRLAVAPRFALACAPDNLRAIVEYARERGLLLHSHAAEQAAEVERVRERTRMGNIEYFHAAGLTGPDVRLAHCIHVSEAEIDLLAETGTQVLHCPTANLKLGSGVANVPRFLEKGIAVALGSDGAACNNRLDLFGDMRVAGLVQKPLYGPQALPADDFVRMATAGGAAALGWGDEMGALDEGRRANVILVERSGAHVLPGGDLATDLGYAHTAADVVMTIVNGRILYEDGRLTTIDEDELRADVARAAGDLSSVIAG